MFFVVVFILETLSGKDGWKDLNDLNGRNYRQPVTILKSKAAIVLTLIRILQINSLIFLLFQKELSPVLMIG